ncbi:MAG: tryptophan synthase subunit alpha [Pseudoflavonifractor sp.]|nr:tryptophan synthase subunit alpha [Pseudoflavonifractor sp.]
MNRLQSLFGRKNKNLLSVYFTAGFPTLDSTGEIIRQLASHGVDMIEVGVPFSDPMADGPVIQQSSTTALRNGMTLPLLLDQVEAVRGEAGDVPLVLMGYLNPMMQYGIERLFKRCKEVGIDALIIPDLPFADYLRDYKELCDRYDLPIIMLITPETSDERIRLIDDHCSGFIYMVSSASTTGTKDSFGDAQNDYFTRIAALPLKHERLIGFGISNADTYANVCRHSAGGIIGSLFIKCLERNATRAQAVEDLLATIGRTEA